MKPHLDLVGVVAAVVNSWALEVLPYLEVVEHQADLEMVVVVVVHLDQVVAVVLHLALGQELVVLDLGAVEVAQLF